MVTVKKACTVPRRIGGNALLNKTGSTKTIWVHISLLILVSTALAGCHEAGDDDGGMGASKDHTIGLVMVLSGDAGPLGQAAEKGARLAVKEINAAGGINGGMLKLRTGDTKLDAAEAAKVFQDVIADGEVHAVIGALASGITKSIIPAAEQAEVVLMSPSSTRADITNPRSPFFFRNIPSDVIQGAKAASILFNDLEVSQTAVMAQNNAYAIGVKDIFMQEYPAVGGTVTGAPVIFHESDEAQYPGPAQDVLATNPGHIWIAGQAPEIAHMIKELRAAGYSGPIMTSEAIEAPNIFDVAGSDLDDVKFTKPFIDQEASAYTTFKASYLAEYGEEIGLFSAYGYDAVYVFAHAMKAGATSGEAIRAHVQEATVPNRVTTPSIAFNQNGDVTTGDYVLWRVNYDGTTGSFTPV